MMGVTVTIQEIMQRWPTQEAAMAHLERVRWGDRPICPYCESNRVGIHASKDKKLPRLQCHACQRAFSATVNTIFHHTHLPLQTWFLALSIMLNVRKNISNAQLARDLGLPYKTAWSLALRIRGAMAADPNQAQLFHGIVEMEAPYIRGKTRRGNTGSGGQSKSNCRGGTNKISTSGVVERNGRAFARVFEKGGLAVDPVRAFYRKVVDARPVIVITDDYPNYRDSHNHSVKYSSRLDSNASIALLRQMVGITA